jgi:hypothetical protein
MPMKYHTPFAVLAALVAAAAFGAEAPVVAQDLRGLISGVVGTGDARVVARTLSRTAGIWTNTRLAKSANYTIDNGDKGSTIALGGTAFFTLTFKAASAYDADFAVFVTNEDSGRGKTILQQLATSSTSLAIGAGSKSFTTSSGLYFPVGKRIRAWSLADNTKWMSGLVASYASTTLTLTVDSTNSSGTLMDWQIGYEDILWPLETGIVFNNNNVWALSGKPKRWKLPGATTFRVSNSGLNNNDCLSTTTAACATWQGAIDLVAANVDCAGQSLIIMGTNGETFSGTATLRDPIGCSSDYTNNPPTLQGAASDGFANYTMSCGADVTCIKGVNSKAGWKITDFTFRATGSSNCIFSDNGSQIYAGANQYFCTGYHLVAGFKGTLEVVGDATSFGSAIGEYFATSGSQIIVVGTTTLTFAGTSSQATFATSDNNSLISLGSNYAGTTTQSGDCLHATFGGGIIKGGTQPCAVGAAETATLPGWIR